MKRITLLLMAFALFSCANKTNQTEKTKVEGIVAQEVEQLATGFRFTEGPAVDAEGNVYFTDIPNHTIFVWTLEGKLDTFRLESNSSNGLYFDKDENLLACETEKAQISSTSPDGEYKIIAGEYDGKKLNMTNDLWPDPKGGIYFTDPKYGGSDKELSQDGMHVYYIKPDHKSVIRVIDDFVKPNGLIGTPNGKILYVTDNQGRKTYKYAIQKDGSLSEKELFAEYGSDGMSIDVNGNVYLTPSGENNVKIFTPAGVLLDSIIVPERPANVCFGGVDRNQLFITARTSLYRVELNTKGVD